MFTLHGTIMIFLFLIPGIPAALGNFVLPLMLGAKDVAFPRLNLASFYLWWGGALFFLDRAGHGRPRHGLDLLHALRHDDRTAVVPAVTGVFILGFSSIFTGINFIVTMHTMRPPGMSWFRMPLFLWGLYATALIQVLATPVLAVTLLLIAVERLLGVGIFDPELGRRPRPVPAFLLVLFPSGGLHHDPAGHGHHQRGDLRVQRASTSSATASSPTAASPSP